MIKRFFYESRDQALISILSRIAILIKMLELTTILNDFCAHILCAFLQLIYL